ncbi:MAG TPA: carbohydrate kinase family protein [Candidatus Saccharimonadales bacterium]|nr:carbohydrate kinase family protein [Candidatus Saccharimonadales bacterium]
MAEHRPVMLAIGTATQDIFLQSPAVFNPHTEGGVEYEVLPLGAKLDVDTLTFSTGGNALNAAVTFARQGLESYFMGTLGTEVSGDIVMSAIDKEGINNRYVRQGDVYHTGYSTILLAPNGERTTLTYHGTKLRADGSDIDLDAIAKADWLYVSSVGSVELLERIVGVAAKHKTKVAINPSSRELSEPDKLKSILEDVSVLITNKDEMQQLVEGKTGEELVHHALNITPTVVVSDGPRGVWASDGKKFITAGIYEDVKVIDRLGAGDAFGSGFVAMVAQGKSLEEAVTFASANSTSVVQTIGATVGVLHKGAPVHDMPLTVIEL